jgi:phage tail sheath protein FI
VVTTCTLDYGAAPAPTDYAQLRPYVETALRAAASSAAVSALAEPARSDVRALLGGATVRLVGRGTAAVPFRFHVLAGRGGNGFVHTDTLAFGGATAPALGLNVTANWQMYRLANGTDSAAITGTNLLGVRSAKTGLFALEDVDLFNILCLPRAADLGADDMRAVYAQAETYCEERRAFALIDVPESVDSLDEMQTWLLQNESLRHRNAAVYFPRVLSPDPLNDNRPRSLGASGTVAGLYARTDAARGVWKAPAGTDARLRNVQALGYLLTDPQNGALNPLGVNCLRTFPVYSHVCWGARTLDGADAQASEWKYVPVRRFTLYLEESLYRGTKWAVFEPNDEPLWAQLRLNIGAFMHNLFRQGAFQGTSPREAYLVKCDKETTTQNDIDQGIVNILVAFAPLKPAEFVIIKIQQKAGQIQTYSLGDDVAARRSQQRSKPDRGHPAV